MSHTPGPWEYVPSKSVIISRTERQDWADEEDVFPEGYTRVVDLHGAMGGDDSNADARLIAAAPELLDAAEWALKALAPFERERYILVKEQCDKLRAAIAKAKGEKP